MTILDTHEAIETMINSGVPKTQAEGIVKAFKNNNKDLTTKDDIRNLKEQMATKVDIEKIRVEIERMNTRIESHMVKTDKDYAWISKLGIAMFTVLLGILITSPNVSNFLHAVLA